MVLNEEIIILCAWPKFKEADRRTKWQPRGEKHFFKPVALSPPNQLHGETETVLSICGFFNTFDNCNLSHCLHVSVMLNHLDNVHYVRYQVPLCHFWSAPHCKTLICIFSQQNLLDCHSLVCLLFDTQQIVGPYSLKEKK